MHLFSTLTKFATIPLVSAIDVSRGAVVEAESGLLTGVTVGTSPTGFSGVGFVQGFDTDGDKITITVESSKQALYDVVIRYAAIYGEKQTTLSINGAPGGSSVVLADTTNAAVPVSYSTRHSSCSLSPGKFINIVLIEVVGKCHCWSSPTKCWR